MLERLELSARTRAGGLEEGNVMGYLSSHPVTRERLDALHSD